MKPRIRVFRAGPRWWACCETCAEVRDTGCWRDAMVQAHLHARTHRRTDIGSFLALRDDHPHDRRWGDALSHDLPEPPC